MQASDQKPEESDDHIDIGLEIIPGGKAVAIRFGKPLSSFSLSPDVAMAFSKDLEATVAHHFNNLKPHTEFLAFFPYAVSSSEGKVHFHAKSNLIPLAAIMPPEVFVTLAMEIRNRARKFFN